MAGDKWDGKISNLNISEQSFPELHAELSKINHKARCDRLRALALLGLYSLQFSGRITTPDSHGAGVDATPVVNSVSLESDAIISQRQLLKNKLLSTV